MFNNKSPLRYPGGKTRACKKLDAIINDYFDMNKFSYIISPFLGGGSFEFFMQNKYNFDIIANDKFVPLFNFWVQCKTNKEKLCSELRKKQEVSKDDFHKYRKDIRKLTNEITQAVYYFIINRCSFSGATLSGGFSLESSQKRFTESSIERIENLNLSNFEIYNEDFPQFINDSYSKYSKCIMFLDPPYYLEKYSKLYGNNGDMHEMFEHEKLYEMLRTKSNWVMTYNNCDYIKNLYKDFTIIETDWSYGMCNVKSKADKEIKPQKKSSEIVIISR